ncbi:hypothetical protein GWO60_04710 [Corynebacterium macginleyi]|nr:hypothetical protein [Corynebacterium macginleyi]
MWHDETRLIRPQFDAIEKKLLANPEMAKLIDELGTSTTDANDWLRPVVWCNAC